MAPEKPLLRTSAAAEAIGVDPTTLTRWVRAGRVKPKLYTAGKQARWDLDDLKRQLDDLHAAEAGQRQVRRGSESS